MSSLLVVFAIKKGAFFMRNVNKIEWEDVDMVELTGVTPKLTENEWIILNNNIEYKEARRKASSVLYFLKKHIILNEGFFSKSIDNIHAMFKRNKNYISTGQLKNIVNKLKELGLICVKRIKKRNVYTLPLADKLAEKLADKKQAQPVENIEIGSNLKKHRYGIKDNNTILNTNKENGTDLISKLKKVYRGVKPSLVASKKQLRDIAQSVLVAKGLHSNTYFDKAVQYLVYKKIKYSNQKINLLGAVSYIEKIIDDRLDAYNNKLVEVPNYITGEQSLAFNDFQQREYDYDALEKQLLGWD